MLLISLILIVLSSATTTRKDLAIMFNKNLLAVFVVALLIILKTSNYHVLKEGVSLFGGLFHNTNLSILYHGFIVFISLIIIQLTAFYEGVYTYEALYTVRQMYLGKLQKLDKSREQFNIIEYPLIILFVIIGAIFLISSSNTISIFLSIELQSYGLYLLCALYRNSESSTGAGLIYFLLGGLSSCFILLALGILYANSGTSDLDNYYLLINLSDLNHTLDNLVYWYNNNYFNYSLVILSIGFLFKVSASPFHFWSPDVYNAIPTTVTAFVANIAKISILIFFTQLVHFTSKLVITNFNWTDCLLLSSLLSLIIGTILGLDQTKIKRLLAYSTISHLGFMLLAISINSVESNQAFLFYLMQYSLTNANAFLIIVTIGYVLSISVKKEDNKYLANINTILQFISQFKGHYYINPVLAISFTIVMYSFVGIPPLIGFFGKQMVLSSALDRGYIFITLVAILTSVISAAYYLNIIKEFFFSKSEYIDNTAPDLTKKITVFTLNGSTETNCHDDPSRIKFLVKDEVNFNTVSTILATSIAIMTLIILFFMITPDQWLSISNILGLLMFN